MRFIKVTTLLIFTTWGSLFLLANDNWLENQPPEFKKVVPVLNNFLNLALDYHELNEFNKELETINNALELCAANNGVDELFTASFWSQKGICLKSLGFLNESIESFRESLRIKILKLGKNAEEVHANHIELGLLYDQLKQTDDAIFHFEKVISKKPKDETKNQIRGHIYSILGRLYESKGSYDLSIQSHLKALKYFEQKLGGNHPQLINYHDNLGLSYQLNRNFRAAIIHFDKAQEIQEANGQRNLTDIASRLNLIGQLYSNLGEYKMALKKQMDALKFYIELHGPDHIQVALSCSNVGYQYQKLGNLDNAQKFHEESLAIRSKLLTPQDPRIAVGLSNLGVINLELGKFPEAVNLLQKGLSIDSIQLGLSHPRVIQYYNNLGFAHLNLNLPQKALDFHEKALRLIPEINVSKEEELAYSGILDTTYNHLANTHGELGSFSKAISYLNLSLSLRLKNQGPSHINVATVYNNLGSIYSKLGELYLSKINFEKALEIMKLRLGYNHKNTATCFSNLGMVEHYLGNHTQAVLLLHQSLEIQESVLDSNHS